MTELHRFRNSAKGMKLLGPSFEEATRNGLMDIVARDLGNDHMLSDDGLDFINLSCCNYLGLHNHPKVLESTIKAVQESNTLTLGFSRMRIRLSHLDRAEREMSEVFGCNCLLVQSASVAALAVLPMMAAGVIGTGEPPVMVYDKHSHFCMNLTKPVCADETEVLTCPHNDFDFLEDVCKKHKNVVYVGDGVYSMGGRTVLEKLKELQDKYGLWLYLDDSHALSLYGENGEGFVRAHLKEEDERTVIVGSLAKGFGASGGVVMIHKKWVPKLMTPFGGPSVWSTQLNVPSCGAVLGSLEVHRSPELQELQGKLQANLKTFDDHIETPGKGTPFPVRVIQIGDGERAAELSGELLRRGFYTSAVFFPIVARGKAGLRAMLRANNKTEDIIRFVETVKDVVGDEIVSAA